MKILVSGCMGHMGQILCKMINDDSELELICGVDKTSEDSNFKCFKSFDEVNVDVDIIVDFSHHSLTSEMINYAIKKNLPLVIATTGQTDEEKKIILEASNTIPIFYAANYSIGIAVLIESAKKIASQFKNADIEIVETHHNRKLDAPSGTALKIAEGLKEIRPDANLVLGRNGNQKRDKKDIGINAVRLGNVVGIHEVLISTEHECISIKHEAYDRGLFAEGA
ncbi:MAG: 4-hydroxy-tetrahydrodipicolinate reductase, partial [Lachnospiraceae bacterium]|nr:4-hydroxy-tetrahydrodipicolinate reductase [Lachnospiraceae bacterium]